MLVILFPRLFTTIVHCSHNFFSDLIREHLSSIMDKDKIDDTAQHMKEQMILHCVHALERAKNNLARIGKGLTEIMLRELLQMPKSFLLQLIDRKFITR